MTPHHPEDLSVQNLTPAQIATLPSKKLGEEKEERKEDKDCQAFFDLDLNERRMNFRMKRRMGDMICAGEKVTPGSRAIARDIYVRRSNTRVTGINPVETARMEANLDRFKFLFALEMTELNCNA